MKTNIKTRNGNKSMKTKLNLIAILLIFFMGFSMASGAKNMLVYWDMEEGSGSVALDKSGNNVNGILINNVQFTTNNAFGTYGIDFIDNAPELRAVGTKGIPEQASLAFWMDPETTQADHIFVFHNNAGNWFDFFYDQDGETSFGFNGSGGIEQSVSLSNASNPPGWQHIVFTYDFVTGDVEYYLNNVLVRNVTVNPLAYSNASLVSVILGIDLDRDNRYSGHIDEFRAFDFILNTSEINELYTNNSASFLLNDTEPITSIGTVNMITSFRPNVSDSVTNKVEFTYNLNHSATCDLYIDDALEETFENIVSFNYDKILTIGEHSHFAYCYYTENNTLFYELLNEVDFNVVTYSTDVEFYVVNENNELILYENIYIHTPCFNSFGGVTNNAGQSSDEFYIKHLENGTAQFSLEYPLTYEFCLSRGQLNFNENVDNFTSNYDIVKVQNQLELGNIQITNETIYYAFKVDDQDLYSPTEPEFWEKTWADLFNLVIALIVGVPIVMFGLSSNNSKIVIAGVLIILAGLGASLGGLIFALT